MSNNIINVAVIGAGSGVAPRHFAAFNAVDGARVVAGVETDDARRAEVAARYGVPMFDSTRELAESGLPIDLVVVCVRDSMHAEVVGDAVIQGWHVLCEKPLAEDRRQAEVLFRMAERQGVYLGDGLQRRYMTPQIDRLAADGTLGGLRRVDAFWFRHDGMPEWRKLLQRRGGVLADLGTHLLSQTVPLFGSAAAVRVTTRASSVMSGAGVEDEALVIIDFEGGGLLTIQCAFDRTLEAGRDEVGLLVVGDHGEISTPLLTGETEEEAGRLLPVLRERTPEGVVRRELDRLRTVGECHLQLAAYVVAGVRLGGSTPQAEVDFELRLMGLLDAAYASAIRGGEPVLLH